VVPHYENSYFTAFNSSNTYGLMLKVAYGSYGLLTSYFTVHNNGNIYGLMFKVAYGLEGL
jgi:hypothetical protein